MARASSAQCGQLATIRESEELACALDVRRQPGRRSQQLAHFVQRRPISDAVAVNLFDRQWVIEYVGVYDSAQYGSFGCEGCEQNRIRFGAGQECHWTATGRLKPSASFDFRPPFGRASCL